MKTEEQRIQDALHKLNVISARASPSCGFVVNQVVYKRLEGPQNVGNDWLTDMRKQEKTSRQDLVADSSHVRQLLEDIEGDGALSRKPLKFTLKNKLRDHVKEIFASNSMDTQFPTSQCQSTYQNTDAMKRATRSVNHEHGLKKDQNSAWSEQIARAKAIGLASRK